jgi:hypothetical protein
MKTSMTILPIIIALDWTKEFHMHIDASITRKCVLVHSGFHYILSEFGHFHVMKLFNPLVNGDQLLRTMTCFTSSLYH